MERISGLLSLSCSSCLFFPKVECGYQVFLECETVDAEIFYTTDGSYPADCNTGLLVSARWLVPLTLILENMFVLGFQWYEDCINKIA